MRDVAGFRDAVREHRRMVGRTQQQLARAIGLHPHVLSHKLNASDGAVLTAVDVTGIVTTLATWGALRTRADVGDLLDLLELPEHTIAAAAWAAAPLASLITDAPSRGRDRTPPAPAPASPPPGPELEPTRLPIAATPLIGRIAERELVSSALNASRLVTLTGVGGTGKTRLALSVGHELSGRYADGAAFTDLAAVSDPALLATALARAVGTAPRSTAEAERQLHDALRTRQLLLVVDNLEHLLDAAPLLARLLAAAPGLRILATSRIPLRLYGEQVIRVPPLGLPADGQPPGGSEAEQLFLQRAWALRPRLHPDRDDLTAISAICRALDGLPLALELAAAGTKLYPPQALLPMLQDRLAMLVGGPRDQPHRQQTLRATLDWSINLLDPAAQQLFASLGVFAGPFDATAAAAVHGGDISEIDMLRQLGALTDHSLLEVTAGATPRFRMLEIVREYALARLAETGDPDAALGRHLQHYLSVATEGRGSPHDRARTAVWVDIVEADYANLNAALDNAYTHAQQRRGWLTEGLRLASILGPLWQIRRSQAEGTRHLERLLALDAEQRAAPGEVRAQALLEACALDCFHGDYRRATVLAEAALTLFEPIGDHRGLARAHRYFGEAALAVNDYPIAEQHFRSALDEACRADERNLQAIAYNMLGQVVRHYGRHAQAIHVLRNGLRLFGATHDRLGVADAMNSLAEVSRDAGNAEHAYRRFRAALYRHWQLRYPRAVAYDLEGIAAVAALRGGGRQALRYLGAAHTLREKNSAYLPPCEQAILDRIMQPTLATLSVEERELALQQGSEQSLEEIIAEMQ